MDSLFEPNVSTSDSVIRMVFGSALILGVLFLVLAPWTALFSIYFIHTAIIRYDPLYAVVLKMRDNLHKRSKSTRVIFHKKTAAS